MPTAGEVRFNLVVDTGTGSVELGCFMPADVGSGTVPASALSRLPAGSGTVQFFSHALTQVVVEGWRMDVTAANIPSSGIGPISTE